MGEQSKDQNRHRPVRPDPPARRKPPARLDRTALLRVEGRGARTGAARRDRLVRHVRQEGYGRGDRRGDAAQMAELDLRSEEHTSELQSLMRISYAVYCLKKKNSAQIQITKILSHSTQTHTPRAQQRAPNTKERASTKT